jgi:uncharacterized protein DUF6152
MKPRIAVLAAAFAVLASAAPMLAHHSFSAEFDRDKPFKATGTVTKVDWQNPHIWFYIDVKDEKTGKVTNYGWEMGSPNGLMRRGWTRNSLKVGSVVTVEGSMAKDGSNNANASTVTIDGKKLFAGSSGDPAN